MSVAGASIKPLVKLGREPDDCWTWLGCHGSHGTPTKRFNGRTMTARAWLWEQLFGPVPDGIVITTIVSCGNDRCVNPRHFRACTKADVNRANVRAILMPADVIEIRRAKKDAGPNTARVLADRFGCSPQQIRLVWNRKRWTANNTPPAGPERI